MGAVGESTITHIALITQLKVSDVWARAQTMLPNFRPYLRECFTKYVLNVYMPLASEKAQQLNPTSTATGMGLDARVG